MSLPKVVSEGKLKLSDNVEITVCVLDDGRHIIPEEDMLKALHFLGLNDTEITNILNSKPNEEATH